MRTSRLVAAFLALALAGLAHAQEVPVYCNTTTSAACNTTTNPGNGSQGEAAWQAFGKVNAWAQQLGLFALDPAGEFLATPATTTGIPGLRSIVVTDLPITVPELNIAGTWTAAQTFNAGVTASGLTLSGITGSIQCLEASSAGVVTGTGSVCGSGSAGPVTLPSSAALGDIWYGSAADVMSALGGYVATPVAGVLMSTPTTLTPPTNGALTATSGGTLAATTYYVKSTWVNANGETVGSTETSLAVSADNVLNVAAPASPPTSTTGWNVYVSGSTGTETKQNSTPIAVGTAWVEPTSGLIAGSALPTANTATVAAAPAWHATSSLIGLTADTSPASGDLMLIHSIAAAADESITIANLLSGLDIPTASSTTVTAGDCFLSTTTAGVYAPGACPSGGVTIQTNGVNNSTQTLLNLAAGSGATLSESAGTVTISSASPSPITFGCGNFSAATSAFVGPGNCSASGAEVAISSVAGTLSNLYVTAANAPSAGTTYALTLSVNSAATAVTCTVAAGATSCSDTTHSAAIPAGGTWSISLNNTSTGVTGIIAFGLEFTP